MNENQQLPLGPDENKPIEPPALPADDPKASLQADAPDSAASQEPVRADESIPGVADFGKELPPRQEYEVSFDSKGGQYTYSASPDPVSPPVKKRKAGRVTLLLGGCLLLLILSLLMGLAGGAIASSRTDGDNGTADHHLPVITQTVVSVNNAEISENAVMLAAAKAVNSVVVIDTFASQSAVEAGEQSGAGSGVIWTADGYIVTCNHVVDGFSIIRVTLADGSTFFADVVGTDARTDLAVLKIAASKLPAVTARGTELVLAETVIAIGNPLGVLSNTVSAGILSCLTREITVEGQTMSLIQIDAAVNHGNSGGGLFDANGSLIGIVNAKSTGDSVEGIGFAIPITTVMDVSNQLIEQGYVSGRPRLGITVVTVSQSNASYVFEDEYYPQLKPFATSTYKDIWGREHTQVIPGVYIYDTSLVAGYAKGSAELEFGDRILFVGGNEVSQNSDVLAALGAYNAGDTIQLTVQRDHSTTIVVDLILGQQGAK